MTATWDFSASAITITTANELYCVGAGEIQLDGDGNPTANSLTGDYVLGNDINLSTLTVDDTWEPIGSNAAFEGSFDGNGKSITNLVVNDATRSFLGLFGQVSNATISDLTLVAPVVTAHARSGALAGTATASLISGITATNVDVSGDGTGEIKVGGLIGHAVNSSITGVSVTGGTVEADGTGYEVGGIIGRLDGERDAASFRPREGDNNVAPVMIVSEVDFSGTVRADISAGGIVGAADTSPTNGSKWIEISHATSAGTVSTVTPFDVQESWNSSVGGIIGAVYDSELFNLQSSMNVTAQASDVGGVVGWLSDSRLRDASATGDVAVTGTDEGDWCGVGGLVGTANVYNRADPAPKFDPLPFINVHASGDVSCIGGDAIGGLIGNAWDLNIQQASASGDVTDGGASHWGGVGGLLGYAYDSHLTGVTVSGDVHSTNRAVGGIVGYAEVSDPQLSATPGSDAAMQGRYSRALIVNEGRFTGNVEGRSRVGGIVGESFSSGEPVQVLVTSSSGAVSGEIAVGGIVGDGDEVILRDVASLGAISGWSAGEEPAEVGAYGGIAGSLGAGSRVERTYTTSTVTTALSGNATVGSFAGVMSGTMVGQSFTVTSATTQPVLGSDSAEEAFAGVGVRSLAQLGQLSTFATWNDPTTTIVSGWLSPRTTEVWGICQSVGGGLPFLQWQRSDACPGVESDEESQQNPGSQGGSGSGSGETGAPTGGSLVGTVPAGQVATPQVPQAGQPSAVSTAGPRPTGLPGLEVVSGPPADALRVMRKPVGSTVASAPTVTAGAGQPVALAVRGLTPGATIEVRVRSNGKSVSLGLVVVGPDGSVTLPAFRAKGANRLTIALVDAATRSSSFVKVEVQQARIKPKARPGAANRSR